MTSRNRPRGSSERRWRFSTPSDPVAVLLAFMILFLFFPQWERDPGERIHRRLEWPSSSGWKEHWLNQVVPWKKGGGGRLLGGRPQPRQLCPSTERSVHRWSCVPLFWGIFWRAFAANWQHQRRRCDVCAHGPVTVCSVAHGTAILAATGAVDGPLHGSLVVPDVFLRVREPVRRRPFTAAASAASEDGR